MNKNVDKIKVGITQKMNLGNYETRDYFLGIEISGFDNESVEKIQEAIDFGRELCIEDVSKYYSKIKDGLNAAEKLANDAKKEYLEIEDRINKSESEEQLRTLEQKIQDIEDQVIQKQISKIFNIKLLKLKKK